MQNSFYFDPIIPQEIETEISLLPYNKALGLYSTPVKLLKLAKSVISIPLTKIFNHSVLTGVYPAKLKYAKVIPVYKGEDETLPENYRPISLLSIYNRLFEKILYRRLIKFIDKNDILYDLQYGFRNKHSTQHAILDIVIMFQGSSLTKRCYGITTIIMFQGSSLTKRCYGITTIIMFQGSS